MNELEKKNLAIEVFACYEEVKTYSGGEFLLSDLIYKYIIANEPTDGLNISEEIEQEANKIEIDIRPYLLSEKYLEKVDENLDFVRLTEKGKEAFELGGIDKYEEKRKEKEKKSELKEKNLIAVIEANDLAKESNTISKDARWISLGSILLASITLIVSTIFSCNNKYNEDELIILKKEIEIIKNKQLEMREDYWRNIDQNYNQTKNLK